MSDQPQELAESHLNELISSNPDDWESRKKLAQLLYGEGKTKQAAEVIWEAPEIPPVDLELGFAAKVLGKGAPQKAIRLLSAIQELNKGKAVQNLGIANALLHYGMVMQAARFYGAAVAEDPSLASPDLEHFLLWVDDKEKLWGDFEKDKPNLAELPWMKRDAKEAENLKKAMQGHTTPVKIPNLAEVSAESVIHEMYVQSSQPNVQPTPPPAVTIPMDRVNPKDVIIDEARGAGQPLTAAQAQTAAPVGGSTGQALPPTPTTLTPKPLTPAASATPLANPATPTQPIAPSQPITPMAPAAATPAAAAPTLLTPNTGGATKPPTLQTGPATPVAPAASTSPAMPAAPAALSNPANPANPVTPAAPTKLTIPSPPTLKAGASTGESAPAKPALLTPNTGSSSQAPKAVAPAAPTPSAALNPPAALRPPATINPPAAPEAPAAPAPPVTPAAPATPTAPLTPPAPLTPSAPLKPAAKLSPPKLEKAPPAVPPSTAKPSPQESPADSSPAKPEKEEKTNTPPAPAAKSITKASEKTPADEPKPADEAPSEPAPAKQAEEKASDTGMPAPMTLSAAAAPSVDADGQVQPIRLSPAGLGDAPAPVLRPVVNTTLVDGKIVLKKPAEKDEA